MRLSDRLLLQQIDRETRAGDYVLIDTNTGEEIVLNVADTARLYVGVEWFAAHDPALEQAIDEQTVLVSKGRHA